MKKQDIIIILIPTLICVIAWIGFNIYDNYVTSTITPQEQSEIIPINPTFNTDVIQKLKQREIHEGILQSASITPTPTGTPTQTLDTKISSISAEASAGGILKR